MQISKNFRCLSGGLHHTDCSICRSMLPVAKNAPNYAHIYTYLACNPKLLMIPSPRRACNSKYGHLRNPLGLFLSFRSKDREACRQRAASTSARPGRYACRAGTCVPSYLHDPPASMLQIWCERSPERL